MRTVELCQNFLHVRFTEGFNPMSSIELPQSEKPVALRKRVTVTFEEFEPARLEPPPDPKKDAGWFKGLLKKLMIVFGIQSIRHLF
jgi:hypothetical protein